MSHVNFYRVVLIAGVSLAAALLFQLWWHNHHSGVDIVAMEDCDLSLRVCGVETDRGRVTLMITPRPIQPLKPLEAVVTLHGFEADRVELLITGINVDMGRLFYPLKRVEGVTEDRRFEGSLSLSICSQSLMIWQALVIIDGTMQLPFRFESEYKSQFTMVE